MCLHVFARVCGVLHVFMVFLVISHELDVSYGNIFGGFWLSQGLRMTISDY